MKTKLLIILLSIIPILVSAQGAGFTRNRKQKTTTSSGVATKPKQPAVKFPIPAAPVVKPQPKQKQPKQQRYVNQQGYTNQSTTTYQVPQRYSNNYQEEVDDDGYDYVEPATGNIRVTSTPSDATIYIDGEKQYYTTPHTFYDMSLGTYTIKVDAGSNYKPMERYITVTEDETTNADFSLTSRYADLSISTQKDATVYIDGQKEGTGNIRKTLPEGKYTIKATLKSHRTKTVEVNIVGGNNQQLDLHLDPIYGTLKVESNRLYDEIIVDGKKYSKGQSIVGDLLIGSHTLLLTGGRYIYSGNFTIHENEVTTVNANLELKQLMLDLSSSNNLGKDAKVLLNGETRIYYPFREQIPAGDYSITVKQKGYKKYKSTFALDEDLNYRINLTKKRLNHLFLGYVHSTTSPIGGYLGMTHGVMGWYVDGSYSAVDCPDAIGPNDYWGDVDVSTLEHKGKQRLGVHAGPILHFSPVMIYVGGGYGKYASVWENSRGSQTYKTYDLKGFELQGGIMLHLGPINLRAGYTKMFCDEKFMELNLGAGFYF